MALGSWAEDALLGRTRPEAWVPSCRAAAARTIALAVLILRPYVTTTHPTLLVAAHGFPAGRRRQKAVLRMLFDGGGRVLSRAHITHEFLLLSLRFQAASRADKDTEVDISKNCVEE